MIKNAFSQNKKNIYIFPYFSCMHVGVCVAYPYMASFQALSVNVFQ